MNVTIGANDNQALVEQSLSATNQQTLSPDVSASARRAGAGSNRLAFCAAIALAAVYFISCLYIASHRLFWFDEILTVRIARLPNLATIWDALAHGADGTPPGYYLLARLSEALFGSGEMAARLSSAIAMAIAMLLTFACARRLTDALHGLIALAVLTCSVLPYYGYEARSYAIVCTLAALSLWIWTRFPDKQRWATAAFGALFFVAVTMHYYAVLLLVPYGLWELYRWRPGQRPSPKLLAAILGVVIAVALLSPLMLSYSHQFVGAFISTPWSPSLPALLSVWGELFPDGLFLLVLIVVWTVLVRLRTERAVTLSPATAGESIGWLFLSIPLAGFVLAEWKTNAFLPRYFIAMLPGVAVAFACCLWRNVRQTRAVAWGVFALLAVFGLMQQTRAMLHPAEIGPYDQQVKVRHYLALQSQLRSEGKKYLVFSSSMLHLEFWQYADAPDDCVLLLASDPSHRNLQNVMELNFARNDPIKVWDVDQLEQHARESALIEPRADFLAQLRKDGFQVVIRFAGPLEIAYLQ